MLNEVSVSKSLPRFFCSIIHRNVIFSFLHRLFILTYDSAEIIFATLKSRVYAQHVQGSVLP